MVCHDIVTHRHTWATHHFQALKTGKREVGGREGGVQAVEEDDIIQRSTSPWSSPLHMVRKADGSWRPSGDFRQLNLVTEPDVYPLPNMLDFSPKMVSACMVSARFVWK
jgi:hypothetical protein